MKQQLFFNVCLLFVHLIPLCAMEKEELIELQPLDEFLDNDSENDVIEIKNKHDNGYLLFFAGMSAGIGILANVAAAVKYGIMQFPISTYRYDLFNHRYYIQPDETCASFTPRFAYGKPIDLCATGDMPQMILAIAASAVPLIPLTYLAVKKYLKQKKDEQLFIAIEEG